VAISFPVKIALPRSKSIVIRCLLIHYLRNRKLLPVFEDDPNDIKIVYKALKVIDSAAETSVNVIDVKDCGAAYRFLMALLATTKGKWLLTGTHRLLQRPILPLVNFLTAKGAKIEKIEQGWQIEGVDLQIDNCDIDTQETSQFASAVMLISDSKIQKFNKLEWGSINTLFYHKGHKEITMSTNFKCCKSKLCELCENPCELCGKEFLSFVTTPNENPYIKMTQTLLQTNNLTSFLALADWSAAVFWLANALLTPNAHYLLENLRFDDLQGDAVIVKWFEKFGLLFTENETGIEVKHIENVDIPSQIIDVKETPDIALVLAVLSVCYPFELTLSGLRNINLKESNRLDILVNELSRFTVIDINSEDSITIHKRKAELPNAFHFDSYNDHRFVMAWSLFKNYGTVEIKNTDCVKKSYPNFLIIVSTSTSS